MSALRRFESCFDSRLAVRTGWLAAALIVSLAAAPAFALPLGGFAAAGAAAGDIQAAVDGFRAGLGGANNGTGPGVFPDGRREINWDAAPDSVSDPNAFPGDFFNGTAAPRARGAAFSTPGTGFLLSAKAATGQPTAFGFPNDFQIFSAERLFSPVGSTITDISFFVPGTSTAALTDGFGAVFTDVEADGTSIEYFDRDGASLGNFAVQQSGNFGFAFLGVLFSEAEVARVRIVSGANPLLANGSFENELDAVVMDDFLYGEPQAIPEPGTLALLGVGLAWLGGRGRRRSE